MRRLQPFALALTLACKSPGNPPEPLAPEPPQVATAEPLSELPTDVAWEPIVSYDERAAESWGSRLSEPAPRMQRSVSLAMLLKETRLAGLVVEEEESLRAVVDAVRVMTGLPLVVTPAAENAVLDEEIVFNLALRKPLSALNALNLIANLAGDEVTWTIRHDAVLFTTAEKARGRVILVSYDIRHLTFGRTDFSAPRIDRLRLLDELEDDDGGGLFGGEGERVVAVTEDDVVGLVQSNVAPGTWSDDGVSIEAANGFLMVRHERAVQRDVKKLLEQLGG